MVSDGVTEPGELALDASGPHVGERGSDCAEQGPVVVDERRSCDLVCRTAFWWRRTMGTRSLERPDLAARRARLLKSRWGMRNTPNQDGGIKSGQHPRVTFPAAQGSRA